MYVQRTSLFNMGSKGKYEYFAGIYDRSNTRFAAPRDVMEIFNIGENGANGPLF
jgi:hypothetical protein